mgnify:CR=1 FL=1
MTSNNLEWSFTRYLASKKSVDDRALNRLVWDVLHAAVASRQTGSPLQVLEVGAGIGTMIERLIDWGLLRRASYTAIDLDVGNIACARERLSEWAERRGFLASFHQQGLNLVQGKKRLSLHLEAIDLHDFIQREQGRSKWDLLIAHAFLDLVNVPQTLAALFQLLNQDGLFYFTVNFDGLTVLEPVIDVELDERILQLYHRSMDERRVAGEPSGDSRAGRHLFTMLKHAGAEIIAAGASDWVVFPYGGTYAEDEAYFLHFIIHTIHNALVDHPELDSDQFARWIEQRHTQIERGELVYLAHQIDFCGKFTAGTETTST